MQSSASRIIWHILRICVACTDSLQNALVTNVLKHYSTTTRKVEAIYLNEGKNESLYKSRITDIYIDYVIWCFTNVQHRWYKPFIVCNNTLDSLVHHNQSNSKAIVLLVERWNKTKSTFLYRMSNHLVGEQHPMECVNLRWNMGSVLDFRIGPYNFTSIANELLPGIGALSPRELLVLFCTIGILSPYKAIALLGAPSLTASIVLDGTLQEITALDTTPIAAAE